MFSHLLQQQVSYNDLVREVKSKNKQIRFLQDKIILIQRQHESKITSMESKFLLQVKKYQQTSKVLEQENILLRTKIQKQQLSQLSLQQSYKHLNNQIKILTQANSSSVKQSRSMKRKYTEQKHEMAKIEQENIQLKTLVNLLEKQVRELTEKNLKLLEEKNQLITIYEDYDQVKFQLQGISNMHAEQYQKQIQIVKDKFRQDMDRTAKQIFQKEFTHNKQPKQSNRLITLNGNHKRDDQKIDKQNQLMITIQESSQKNEPQQFIEQRQNQQLPSLQRTQQFQKYMHQTHKSRQNNCGKCIFEGSWSQDVICLNHLISFGQNYLQASTINFHQQRKSKLKPQQQYESRDNNQQQSISNKQIQLGKLTDNLSFNHHQSRQILDFILSLVEENKRLYEQVVQKENMIDSIKRQFRVQMQSLQAQILSIKTQQQQKQVKFEQLQAHYNNKIEEYKSEFKSEHYQFLKIKSKLYNTQQKFTLFKDILKAMAKISTKAITKYLWLDSNKKCVELDSNQNKAENSNLLNGQKRKFDKSKAKISSRIKFKKVIISLIFIATLKNRAHKLRRRTLLVLGHKLQSRSNKNLLDSSNLNRAQIQQDTIVSKQQLNNWGIQSLMNYSSGKDQFYIQSTQNIILKHFRIPRQLNIHYRLSTNNTQVTQFYQMQRTNKLLQKCLYDSLKQQILRLKGKNNQNLQLQAFCAQIKNLHASNRNESKINLHETALKIILQQLLLPN